MFATSSNTRTEEYYLTLIEENKSKIQRICQVYASNSVDKKDLIQEVFYQIWKSLPSFSGKAHINTWVYRIILNVCLKSVASTKKNDFVSLESIHFENNIANETSSKEKYEQLYACISLLPTAEKNLVVLFLEDLPYKEIAEIIGISENYVAVKLKRIRKKLFNCLTSES